MNITDNLIRIKEGKDNIIKSLKNKGVSINDNTLINEIPTIIDNAEIGGGGGDTPSVPTELVQKYEGASVFRINVPEDNYEFAINLCNDPTKATYDVDWGDGVLESGLTTDEQHHIYSKKGTYDVNVYNLSKEITLGGSYSTNGISTTNVYYLFNNINNDSWDSRYIYQKDNTTITNVLIGDKITSIGSKAFQNCTSLQSIVIPEGVTSISTSVFYGCSSLQSIELPSTLTSIGSTAFGNCTSLQSIELPSTLTSIDSSAFENCTSLQSIVIPNSVTSIGSNAFSYCSSLQSIVIPEGVTSIGSNAFSYCSSLQSIVIPNSVTSIGSSAFSYCYSLQIITCLNPISPTIQSNSFPTSSFNYTKRYLYVPKNSQGYDSGNWKIYLIDKAWELRYIEDRIKTPTTLKLKTKNNFFHNLQVIGQAKLIDYELVDNEYIYHFDDKIIDLIRYTFYNNVLEEIELPKEIEVLSSSVFYGCSSLQSIVIPNSVTSIGSSAFSYCSSLQSIELPNTLTSIGSTAFGNCTSLQSIVIPNSVTSIGSSAFSYCSSLQSIVIPEGVTSIGSNFFEKCSSLQSVDLSSTITEIKTYAFMNCTAVHTFICRAMVAPTSANGTWNGLGSKVPSGTPKILYIPNGATGYDNSNTYWKEFFSKGFTIKYLSELPITEL